MGTISIDYYFTPQSPWTYLGHARFAAIAKAHGAKVNVLPVDLGKVFPVSGGLPLANCAGCSHSWPCPTVRAARDETP